MYLSLMSLSLIISDIILSLSFIRCFRLSMSQRVKAKDPVPAQAAHQCPHTGSQHHSSRRAIDFRTV